MSTNPTGDLDLFSTPPRQTSLLLFKRLLYFDSPSIQLAATCAPGSQTRDTAASQSMMTAAFASPTVVSAVGSRTPPLRCSFVSNPVVSPRVVRRCRLMAVATSDETRLAKSTKRIIVDEPIATPGGWFVEVEVRDDALEEDEAKAASQYVACGR